MNEEALSNVDKRNSFLAVMAMLFKAAFKAGFYLCTIIKLFIAKLGFPFPHTSKLFKVQKQKPVSRPLKTPTF